MTHDPAMTDPTMLTRPTTDPTRIPASIADPTAPMIELRGVCKRFGGQQVLDGATLSIARAQTTVIIGRSGAGKSVVLKHIVGLLQPDAGEIVVEGDRLASLTRDDLYRVRRKLGYVFQGAALFDSLTVSENVGLGLVHHSTLSRRDITARVSEKLALVGLEGVERQYPAELSGGMRKRVGVARAIAMDPAIVLYDEPTTGLDPIMSDVINELILHLQHKLGITSVVVTHDMTSAYKVGTQVAMLYNGAIIFQGTPDAVKSTENPYVRQFIEGRADGPIRL